MIFQQVSVGNATRLGQGQFKFVQSRSSSGEYIIQGEKPNFRLVKSVVEGSLITSPFGYNTEKIITLTNQVIPSDGSAYKVHFILNLS